MRRDHPLSCGSPEVRYVTVWTPTPLLIPFRADIGGAGGYAG